MNNLKTINGLPCQNAVARNCILKQYKKLGESKAAIKEIQNEIKKLVATKYKIESILPNYLQTLERVETTREHKVIRLTQHGNFKIAIHIVPSKFEIPSHAHPLYFSAINVQHGDLHIEQESLSSSKEKFNGRLKANQVCVGLLNLRNIHKLQTLKTPCIFISFSVLKKQISPSKFLKKLLSFAATSAVFIFSGLLSPSLASDENSRMPSASHYWNSASDKVSLANKLRSGNGIAQDLYVASQIYRQEAIKGNAEAQYWLGVMHLDGSGITEDADEALHWIATSSDQRFPPAQKLLHHLLVTEEVVDC